MRRNLTPALLLFAGILTACGTTPRSTSLLEHTQEEYQMAQRNPAVMQYAPLELRDASDALAMANGAAAQHKSSAEIDRLAYLARQKIELTQQVARQKQAEADSRDATAERNSLLLAQRTDEADQSWAAAKLANAQNRDTQLAMQASEERNAQLELQLAGMATQKTQRGIVITFGDVLFGTDLSRLTPDGMRNAQRIADVLHDNPQRHLLIEGFTDSVGTADYNQGLSERRADAVLSALLGMGVTRDRIETRGYGEEFPVAANDSDSNRQLNRRVEIVLSDEAGRLTPR
ncbi:OmpA family protein [Leeia oryzae]|uniref:OmpA family protein n=1 Tax=Leeia oryzae TaxID=356662 RepID=UPI000371A8DD|nr:OmpA family protein [Leeia oryzae]